MSLYISNFIDNLCITFNLTFKSIVIVYTTDIMIICSIFDNHQLFFNIFFNTFDVFSIFICFNFVFLQNFVNLIDVTTISTNSDIVLEIKIHCSWKHLNSSHRNHFSIHRHLKEITSTDI